MELSNQLAASLGNGYRLEHELSPGGMARVFIATEVALGRKVVVKLLAPEMSSLVLAERFRREMSFIAQLRHPNIIPLLAAGDAGGLLYYTMPFVQGQTLRTRLGAGGPIPVREAVGIFREMADALSYAHAQGVVHRDIKPENVLLENGHAIVADFGISKALADAGGANDSMIATLTTAGLAIGTSAYMAPEQAAGDPATDHRADIYALGVVAYEMFAGAPPFVGSAHQVIAAHMTAEPEALAARRPDIPATLNDLTMRLLSKNPESRPQNAGDIVEAIDDILSSGTLSNPGFASTRMSEREISIPATLAAHRRAIPPLVWTAALTLLVVIAGIAAYAVMRPQRHATDAMAGGQASGAIGSPSDRAVAVLPFVNTTGDAENEHFSNGLTDELINALGQVRGLKVAARTSVFALSRKGLGARALADTLGVTTLLEGSARRDGKRLKVTAQLINARDETVLWSQTFDRELVDVFRVQEEIARAIVAALNVRLTESEGARLRGTETRDMEAYDLYLKGRFAWNKRSRDGVETAVGYFHSAIQRDSSFALPFAGLAEAYVVMSNYGFVPVPEALAHAAIAAERALALNSSLPEAHASKGFVLASQGQFVESEKEFRMAIELNPSYPLAHHFYSLLLVMGGRFEEARVQNRITLSLDPLSVPGNAHRGILLIVAGNYADARVALQQAVSLSGGNALAPYTLGSLDAAEGRYQEGLPMLERAFRDAPGFPSVKGALAYTYAHLGRRSEADAILKQMRAEVTDSRTRIQFALAQAINGNVPLAYQTLGNDAKWDVPTLINARMDPLLAAFRADPRYPRLLPRWK